MARKCPRGQILRKAYITKKGSKVSAKCIKDRGLPGKGKRLFTLRRGMLGKYGYNTKISDRARRTALRKAVSGEEYATIVRRLNALSILQKNTNPRVYKILRSDMEWMKNTYR